MSDVWRAEVQVDGIVEVLPTPPSAGTTGLPPLASHGFTVVEATRTYRILVEKVPSGAVYRTEVYMDVRNFADADPYTSTLGAVLWSDTIVIADGGSAYSTGGQLAVEKDEAADEVRFLTPHGNRTLTMSTDLGFLDNARINPSGMGLRLRLRDFDVAATHSNQVKWHNFWGLQNGTRLRGASLSAAQPGVFTAMARSSDAVGLPEINKDFVQESARYRTGLLSVVADPAAGAALNSYYRQWNGGDNEIPMMVPHEIDLVRSDEHGILWIAYSTSTEPETLKVARSFDKGDTWEEREAYTAIEAMVMNPSLMWFKGKLFVVFSDGMVMRQAVSYDLGYTWEENDIIIGGIGAADNPRVRALVLRNHGLSLYFFRDLSGNILVARTGDFHESGDYVDGPGALTVYAGADDAPLEAWEDGAGYLYLFFEAGAASQYYRSPDLGTSWEAVTAVSGFGSRPRAIWDQRSALSYHVNWFSVGSKIVAYASGNHGVDTAPTGGPWEVESGLDEQTADIEIMADGGAIVGYFNAADVLTYERAYDYAHTWEP